MHFKIFVLILFLVGCSSKKENLNSTGESPTTPQSEWCENSITPKKIIWNSNEEIFLRSKMNALPLSQDFLEKWIIGEKEESDFPTLVLTLTSCNNQDLHIEHTAMENKKDLYAPGSAPIQTHQTIEVSPLSESELHIPLSREFLGLGTLLHPEKYSHHLSLQLNKGKPVTVSFTIEKILKEYALFAQLSGILSEEDLKTSKTTKEDLKTSQKNILKGPIVGKRSDFADHKPLAELSFRVAEDVSTPELNCKVSASGDIYFTRPVQKFKASQEAGGLNIFRVPISIESLGVDALLSTELTQFDMDCTLGASFVNTQFKLKLVAP